MTHDKSPPEMQDDPPLFTLPIPQLGPNAKLTVWGHLGPNADMKRVKAAHQRMNNAGYVNGPYRSPNTPEQLKECRDAAEELRRAMVGQPPETDSEREPDRDR